MKKLILLSLGLAALALASAHAQGTIQLNNSVGTPIRCVDLLGNPQPNPTGLRIEVWWGTGAELALGGSAGVGNNGIIFGNSLSVFQIAGSEPGTTVNLQIRAVGDGAYGQTAIKQVTLGPTAGPGTVIWQGATGTHPNRFTPLIVICPEPCTIAIGAIGGLALLFRRRKARSR